VKNIDHTNYPKTLKKKSTYAICVTDCEKTLAVWRDHPNGGYYLDEIHYCLAELKRRSK